MVLYQPLGASVSLRVLTGLQSVPMPVGIPSDEVTPRGPFQLDVLIPPGVFSIVPPAASSFPSVMRGVPVTGAIGLNAPLAQTECPQTRSCGPIGRFWGNAPRP